MIPYFHRHPISEITNRIFEVKYAIFILNYYTCIQNIDLYIRIFYFNDVRRYYLLRCSDPVGCTRLPVRSSRIDRSNAGVCLRGGWQKNIGVFARHIRVCAVECFSPPSERWRRDVLASLQGTRQLDPPTRSTASRELRSPRATKRPSTPSGRLGRTLLTRSKLGASGGRSRRRSANERGKQESQYTHFGLELLVRPDPIEFDASVIDRRVARGDRGVVEFSLTNAGSETVRVDSGSIVPFGPLRAKRLDDDALSRSDSPTRPRKISSDRHYRLRA